MFAFILRRLLQSVLVMLTVALVSFGLFRYIGDPVNNMVGQEATMAEREALRESLGLDDVEGLLVLPTSEQDARHDDGQRNETEPDPLGSSGEAEHLGRPGRQRRGFCKVAHPTARTGLMRKDLIPL